MSLSKGSYNFGENPFGLSKVRKKSLKILLLKNSRTVFWKSGNSAGRNNSRTANTGDDYQFTCHQSSQDKQKGTNLSSKRDYRKYE